MEVIAGFFLANLGLVCGYFLTELLPDEKVDVRRFFGRVFRLPFLSVVLLNVVAGFFRYPLSAGILFVLLLLVGSSVADKKSLLLLWFFGTAASAIVTFL